MGGRQRGLSFAAVETVRMGPDEEIRRARQRPVPLVPLLTAEEAARHIAFVASELGDKAIWKLAG